MILAIEPGKRIVIDVLGTPAPKGSARAFVNKKTGRAIFSPGGSKSTQVRIKAWDGSVREAAREVVGSVEAPPFVDLPLIVTVIFRMARPMGHWGKGRNEGKLTPNAPEHPRSKPDIDKLLRATLDALTGIVFDDDGRISRVVVQKTYAAPGDEGATIYVESLISRPVVSDRLDSECREMINISPKGTSADRPVRVTGSTTAELRAAILEARSALKAAGVRISYSDWVRGERGALGE